MIPILFEYDATEFVGHGIGDLTETISCVVSQTDTNEFELELVYPVNGRLYTELKINRIIYAKVNNNRNTGFNFAGQTLALQAFRIYSFEKNVNGTITVKAQHISYDLAQVYVMPGGLEYDSSDPWYSADMSTYGPPYGIPFGGGSIITAYDILDYFEPEHIISGENRFNIQIYDNYENAHDWENRFTIDQPRSIRSILFDSSDSLIANYGGVCIYNNFNLLFVGKPSNTLKATIEYGTNLIDMTQEQNISQLVTGILPYYRGEDARWKVSPNYLGSSDTVVYGNIIRADGTFERENIIPVDVSSEIDSAGLSGGGFSTIYDSVTGKYIDVPNVDYYARQWMRRNEIGIPEINVTLDYSYLATDTFLNTNLQLYDVVKVRFVKMGIDVLSRITSTKYDTLQEQNVEVEIGKSKASSRYYSEYAFGNEYRGKVWRN